MNNIQEKLEGLLLKVEKPARYIGGEPNQIIKNPGEYTTHFALCFPDTYEIGMSWTGMSILYHLVNKTEHTYMERVFTPAFDMQKLMKENDIPLYTLETKTAVRDCDIVGFTLQYEMSYTNILSMLSLSNIPFYSKDRDDSYPLIIAGGPCAFNAEPLADFFDVIQVGDGEELLPHICEIVSDAKKKGLSKSEVLSEIQKLQGVYIPSYYEPVYDANKFIKFNKINTNAPDKVLRAILPQIEPVDFPKNPIVPLLEVVHERAVSELFRGCTRGCRFCQAGMIYRPVRERSLENNYDIAIKQLENTGHQELSLLSLSTSDYTQFEPLVTKLMDYCKPRQIGISLPSLRLDNFAFTVLDQIQGVRKTGLTFAPEAGTQRLRDVINKNITEADILGAIDQAMDLGWNSVKLYFMIGLPTETYEDLDGIVDIARKIVDLAYMKNHGHRGRFNVSVSVSNFVPKPFTPFQWVAQNSSEEFEQKHIYLKEKFKGLRGVTLHYHGSYTSHLEAIFARGDRRLSKTLVRAFEYGCQFDSWSDLFKEDEWKKALEDTGIDDSYFALNEIDISDSLPWDIIDSGISHDFLLSEFNKSKLAQTTKDCRYGCNGCGINKHTQCKWGGIYE